MDLYYNQGRYRISSDGRIDPINNIVFGPLHTIHYPNGELATTNWFYETGYIGPLKSFNMEDELFDLYKFQEKVRMFLRRSKFQYHLEVALRKYAQALDFRDLESSYLRLWGLLEYLTNTNKNGTHKETVKRASFFFQEREYAQQVLNHLRHHRNKSVHTGENNQNIETLLYQLKNFVEVILRFLIVNKFQFSNWKELTQFMNLPNNTSELKRRKKIIESALNFIDH